MPKYFVHPFAESGDKTAVPDNAQVDGSVSYDTGWTFDYERDPDPLVDPLTKDIPRDQSNQLAFDITENIKFIQDNTVPEWSSVRAGAGGYPKNARLINGGVIYISTVNSNSSTPGASSTWIIGGETDPTLVAIAALTPTTNQLIYFTNTDIAAVATITSFGRSLIAANNDSAGRSVLGILLSTDTQEGLIREATDSEVNSGASVDAAVTPRQLRLGFSISLGPAGYAFLPSWLGGWGVQWDITGFADRNVTTVKSLSFPSNCYFFACGFADNIGRGDVSIGGKTTSNTTAEIYYHRDSGGGSVPVWWFALGN